MDTCPLGTRDTTTSYHASHQTVKGASQGCNSSSSPKAKASLLTKTWPAQPSPAILQFWFTACSPLSQPKHSLPDPSVLCYRRALYSLSFSSTKENAEVRAALERSGSWTELISRTSIGKIQKGPVRKGKPKGDLKGERRVGRKEYSNE